MPEAPLKACQGAGCKNLSKGSYCEKCTGKRAVTKPNGNAGGGEKSVSDRGRELMASKAYNDPWHPEHDKVVAEVNALYAAKK